MNIIKLLILFSTLIFFTTGNASAQQSETIFHQGILTDDTGEVVEDGSFIFTFRIYNVETGGESLWTENQVLQVRGGIFNAHLGSEQNLDLLFDEKYWISVTIDGGDELEPRMPLSAVPYAMHALSVKDGVITGAKLDPEVLQAGTNISVELDENNNFVISANTPEEGTWNINGSNISYMDGNVGIGTSTPGSALEVDGDISVNGELSFEDGSKQRTGGPIAKGFVNSDGTIENAVNVTSVTLVEPGRYQINLQDEYFWYNEYSVVVTPVTFAVPRYTSNGGNLIIEFENDEEPMFTFVVYKL